MPRPTPRETVCSSGARNVSSGINRSAAAAPAISATKTIAAMSKLRMKSAAPTVLYLVLPNTISELPESRNSGISPPKPQECRGETRLDERKDWWWRQPYAHQSPKIFGEIQGGFPQKSGKRPLTPQQSQLA